MAVLPDQADERWVGRGGGIGNSLWALSPPSYRGHAGPFSLWLGATLLRKD